MSPPGAHLGSVGRQVAAETAGASTSAPPRPRSAAPAQTGERAAVWLRLAAFFGLAAFAAGHWASLVEDPSFGRILLVVLVATAGATALIGLGATGLRRELDARLGDRPRAAGALIAAAAVLVGLATIALGLGAAGLPLRLLGPENWAELVDGLDRGLAGVQSVDWPYDGPEEWIRLTVLLGAPLLLGLAAVVAFFPVRRGRQALHALGLALLLLTYGTAVTEHDPGEPLMRGLVLLLLVAAWLWLPRLRMREAAAAAAAVMAVGLLSLPVAAALDGDQAWWNYRAWNWFGSGKAITFDWTHEYGPLDWPREGTTLLNIRSDRPHYWKAETLDAFDGLRWFRSPATDRDAVRAELPVSFGEREGGSWDLFEYNPRWDERIDVTVRSLSTDLVIGAGTVYTVDGVAHNTSGDGTSRVDGAPLEKGDSYTVGVYAPDPTRRQMRESSGGAYGYPGDFVRYTRIYLPRRNDDATQGSADFRSTALGLREPLFVPLRGEPLTGQPDADQVLRRSRYGDMYRLALDWTAGARTNYDRVKAIEAKLQENYIYAERVPTRPIPLNGFLFEDRRGYCQQFSGTMALMLRMLGVPTRVAAGFSPGSYNRDTGEYRVRDLDAHSWVEVYFTGIGWVPFDPTPTASPAESQSAGVAATSAASADAGEVANPRGGVAAERVSPGSGVASGADGTPDWVVPVLILAAITLLGAAGWYVVRRLRVQHRLNPEELAEAQLAELLRALRRLDWRVPAATTLLGLERRLLRGAGPHSAGYARGLREHRYDPRSPRAPGARERRALRRELTARGGVGRRLRGLVALPPGGPRPI